MNRKSALILSGVLGTFFSTSAIAALNCTASPDCASLGYTMSAADCTDGVKVACPTDTSKVFCKTMPALSILYGDGTVDKNILSGKTPVGIVFDEKNKLAVALTDINESGCLLYTSRFDGLSADDSGFNCCPKPPRTRFRRLASRAICLEIGKYPLAWVSD